MTRSSVMRYSSALILGLLALLVISAPASAGRVWCARDPIVEIQGTQLQILVAVPEEYAAYVNGPIHVDISTPMWATPELLFVDAGFNGHGERVTFSHLPGQPAFNLSRTQVSIDVDVPIAYDQLPRNTQVPVQVTLIPSKGKTRVVVGDARSTSVGMVLESTD